MYPCVTATLNQPTQLDKQQTLPRPKFKDIPKFPIPWNGIYIRIILWVAALACMIQEATFRDFSMVPSQAICLLFELAAILYAVFCETKDWNASVDPFNTNYVIHFFILSLLVILLFFTSIAAQTSYYFTTANICGLVAHWKYRNRRLKYYSEKLKEQEGLMIDRLVDNMGPAFVFGRPFVNNFWLYAPRASHAVIWAGYSDVMNDKLTLPSDLYYQKRGGNTVFYVPWASYYSVNKKIKEEFPIVEDLVAQNASLRGEVKRKSRLLMQLKKKIHGSWVDCTDLQETPAMPAALSSWNPAEADALFVSIDSILSTYVNLNDYRNMVLHRVNLKDTIDSLKDENSQLKELIQKRMDTSFDLIKQVLKWKLSKKSTPDQSSPWDINDVD